MVVSRKLGELRAGRHDDDDDVESGDADGAVVHAGACQLSQPTCCSCSWCPQTRRAWKARRSDSLADKALTVALLAAASVSLASEVLADPAAFTAVPCCRLLAGVGSAVSSVARFFNVVSALTSGLH